MYHREPLYNIKIAIQVWPVCTILILNYNFLPSVISSKIIWDEDPTFFPTDTDPAGKNFYS